MALLDNVRRLVGRSGTRRVFVVMPIGRVGSNLLMSYLVGFKGTKSANEQFRPHMSAADQHRWLEDFYFDDDARQAPLVVDKERQSAFADPDAIEDYICQREISVIRMFRRDLVRTAISFIRAQQLSKQIEAETGKPSWGLRRGHEPLGKTVIDVKRLAERVKTIERRTAELKQRFLDTKHIDIDYEDLAADIQSTMARTAHFIGQPHREFEAPFKKATPEDFLNVVENRDEVSAYLESRASTSPVS